MNNYYKYSLITLFFIFFLIGLFIFKDFGVGLEETFQRASGFYWLSYLSELSGFENLKNISNIKYNEVYLLNPNLPKVTDNPSYGIILDVPVALLEIFINFDNEANNIYLKHFFVFLIFFLSSLTFCLMLLKRFSNFIVALFGSLAYFFSPKIFGASFFDGKDLFFLSIFTITIYFYQKYETNKKIIFLIIFSIFSAVATSSRIFGLIVPITFLLIYFLKILSGNNFKKNISIIFIFISTYFSFLFIHWPYLWNLSFNKIYRGQNIKVLFDGVYYDNLILPLNYIPKLIFLTTPIFILIFFLIGLFIVFKRFFIKLVNIKTNETKIYLFDFWRGKNEELDFFILLLLCLVSFAYVTFNVQIYSSWRHFLFLHFFFGIFFFLFNLLFYS